MTIPGYSLNLPIFQNLPFLENGGFSSCQWFQHGICNNIFSPFLQYDFNMSRFSVWGNCPVAYESGSGVTTTQTNEYRTTTASFAQSPTSTTVTTGFSSTPVSGSSSYSPPSMTPVAPVSTPASTKSTSSANNSEKINAREVYDAMNLSAQGLSYEVFAFAIEGYNNLKDKGNGKLGIFDTSQSADSERYYLIDLNTRTLVGRSVLKTGEGDMDDMIHANTNGSHATLSGFMKVGAEYYSSSKHRWSMYLDGLDKGINDQAIRKSVVVHQIKIGQPNTWGCLGFSPVVKGGKVDAKATREKMHKLFPEGTIIFTKPTDPRYREMSEFYKQQDA